MKAKSQSAFTLLELMVAMGILSVLMLMMTILLDQVQKSWTYSENRISQFREARVAFDLMTKNLSQASLNTYWDLRDNNDDGIMDGYFKTSELHFLTLDASDLGQQGGQQPVGHGVFFQAPLGFSSEYRNLNNLFNGRGYFVSFGSDANFKPQFLRSRTEERFRYRLMEFRPPAESNQVFADGQEQREAKMPQIFDRWYKQSVPGVGRGDFESHLNPLAENIVMMVVAPRDSLGDAQDSRSDSSSTIAPNYFYNSNDSAEDFEDYSQQVPPLVRLTLVAIDETTAARLHDGNTMPDMLPTGLFRNADNYNADLLTLRDFMQENNYGYKVFSSIVMLRSSRWGGT